MEATIVHQAPSRTGAAGKPLNMDARNSHGPSTRAVCICLKQRSITVKRFHDHSDSYKGKYLIGPSLQFRVLVYNRHDWKHCGMQADMVLKR